MWIDVPLVLLFSALGCRAQPIGSVEGMWYSDGYGFFLEVGSGEARLSEVTEISCIPLEETFARAMDGPLLILISLVRLPPHHVDVAVEVVVVEAGQQRPAPGLDDLFAGAAREPRTQLADAPLGDAHVDGAGALHLGPADQHARDIPGSWRTRSGTTPRRS